MTTEFSIDAALDVLHPRDASFPPMARSRLRAGQGNKADADTPHREIDSSGRRGVRRTAALTGSNTRTNEQPAGRRTANGSFFSNRINREGKTALYDRS